MTPRIAEYVDEQIRAAVDHARMLGKLRRRVDHPQQLDHLLHAAEIAQFVVQYRQQIEADELRMPVGFVGGHGLADLARHQVAGFVERPLAGQEQQIAFTRAVREIADRRRHLLEFQAARAQPVITVHLE